MKSIPEVVDRVLNMWWGSPSQWPIQYRLVEQNGQVCLDWSTGLSGSVHTGSGKFIDQLTDMVVAADEGKSQYRVVWHTMAGELYRHGINPTDGRPFSGTAPPIGLPVPNKNGDVFVTTPPKPVPVGPEAGFGKLNIPIESFPNWGQGDLKAEQARRKRNFDSLWEESKRAWTSLQSVNAKIK